MYDSATDQVLAEFRMMSKEAILHEQLEELGQVHKLLRPGLMQDVFEAPTAQYLQADATNLQQIANEG